VSREIDPSGVYSVKEVCQLLSTGRQTVYRAVRAGDLKAVPLNDRGDLRIRGQWVLDYLERLADRLQRSKSGD
jgi:excisionase family DNA binding protein